jgi:hypothetical protein
MIRAVLMYAARSNSGFAVVLAMLALAAACGDGTDGGAGGMEPCDLPTGPYEKSPGAALEGAGWHRMYVQGGEAAPLPDGRFAMSELRNEVAFGDHFLLSAGALVEFTYPVVDALTGHVALHIARTDDPGVVARYQLSVVRGAETVRIFSFDDPDSGDMGYVPFEGCFYGGEVIAGDSLLLRITNITGGMFGVVVRSPDYFTWIDVEVAAD